MLFHFYKAKNKKRKKNENLRNNGVKIPRCILLNDWIHQVAIPELQVRNIVRAGLAVSVPHDVHRRLVPPIQHHHCKDMPDLVA